MTEFYYCHLKHGFNAYILIVSGVSNGLSSVSIQRSVVELNECYHQIRRRAIVDHWALNHGGVGAAFRANTPFDRGIGEQGSSFGGSNIVVGGLCGECGVFMDSKLRLQTVGTFSKFGFLINASNN